MNGIFESRGSLVNGKKFCTYRNNHYVSCVHALPQNFNVSTRLRSTFLWKEMSKGEWKREFVICTFTTPSIKINDIICDYDDGWRLISYRFSLLVLRYPRSLGLSSQQGRKTKIGLCQEHDPCQDEQHLTRFYWFSIFSLILKKGLLI